MIMVCDEVELDEKLVRIIFSERKVFLGDKKVSLFILKFYLGLGLNVSKELLM